MAIEKILLAVGPKDSKRADVLAEEVIDVAGPTGAEVVIGHVFTKDEFASTVERLDFDDAGGADPDEVARRHSTIRDIANRLDEADVEYSIRGTVGEHADEIIDLAKDVGADRVVVGGRERSPTGKAVFGSTAQDVMLKAPCPVTFVKGE
jgi:nucleotide-binding universal stress UspA family protein